MKVSRFLAIAGRSGNRPSVLIFGASGGGQSQFDRIKKSYRVVGFVDNALSKQGSSFKQKTIYSPQDIPNLSYDKIIIASCYYQEITEQLINDIDVEPAKISVFHPGKEIGESIRSRITRYIGYRYFRNLLNTNRPLLARIGFSVAKSVDATYRKFDLRPISWLDKQPQRSESILRKEKHAVIYGPRIVGKIQRTDTVLLPAVCQIRYINAIISCTSNSILCNEKLFMWRSPTSENRYSDYSVGYIIKHGKKFAITETVNVAEICKGVAITGSVDVNYYHWMLEVVSKLAYIDEMDEVYADYPILISEKAKEIEAIAAFLRALDLRREILYLRTDTYYQVGDLLTITPPNYTVANFNGKTRYDISDSYFRPSSLQFIRKTGLACQKCQSLRKPSSSKIFLARKGVFRPYNQDAVWEVLYPEGFDIVYLEDLSFADQVSLMQHARLILGPTGSAWANLIFCNAGAKALCWMAEEYGQFSCFSHIAVSMGVDMEYLLYETGSTNSRELFYREYTVDISRIRKWLAINRLQ